MNDQIHGQVLDLRVARGVRRLGIVTAFACGAFAACAGSDDDLGKGGGASGPSGQDKLVCDVNGFEAAKVDVKLDVCNKVLKYQARTATAEPFDQLLIESYQYAPFNGPDGPGSYMLNGVSFKDCALCVLATKKCTDASGCEKVFYADTGNVVITSLSGPGSRFSGILANVIFTEVTINSQTGSAIPVVGGGTWCIRDLEFDEEVIEEKADPVCVAEGNGAGLGDNISDFSLQNCNGETVSLHSKCGGPKAVWIMAVTGWCPACADAVPAASQAYRDNGAAGLDLMVVLGEDEYYNPPTLENCQAYAASHDIDPALMYLDSGSTYGAWETTFSHINPYSNGEILLPWSAVLRGSNMEYHYADSYGGSSLNAALNDLLND